MTALNEPFVVHTFVETRGTSEHRVFHPVGDYKNCMAKRKVYNDRRLNGSGADVKPLPGPGEEPLQFDCYLDRFIVMADRNALLHNEVKANCVWWACRAVPGTAMWIRMNNGDLVILNFPQVPDEHRKTQPLTVRGPLNGRSKTRLLAAIREAYEIPDLLLEYDEDLMDYEITIHLPQADTFKYNRLRQERVVV